MHSGFIPLVLESVFSTENGEGTVENLSDSLSKENLSKIYEGLVDFAMTKGLDILVAVLILVIGFKLIKFLTGRLKKSRGIQKIEPTAQSFLSSAVNISAKIIVIITAAAILGVPMTSVIAVIGSCGLALGLALQGSLSNIAGGFILMVFKPFVIGDYIDTGGYSGNVTDIGIFNTKILTLDNKVVIIPNSVISNQEITNVTTLRERRVDLEFSVGYESDIDKVKSVLISVASAHELVLKDPAPFARLTSHGDSALVFTLRVWCKTEDFWSVHYDMLENVKKAFDAEGISIPFPQLDVHTGK